MKDLLTQLQDVANHLYKDGQQYIMEGNTCDEIVTYLTTLLHIAFINHLPTGKIQHWLDDLKEHNIELKKDLQQQGQFR